MKFKSAFSKGLLLAGLLVLGNNAMAQQNTIELEHKAEQSETYIDENGTEQTRMVSAGRVIPGEEILFTVTYSNVGEQPAQNITITNPVPDHMDYMIGSASGDNAAITYSIDGGANFDVAENLTVTAEDGSKKPAAAADYTHIRWIVQGDIAPATSGTVQFTAVVE